VYRRHLETKGQTERGGRKRNREREEDRERDRTDQVARMGENVQLVS